ncbi:iron-containing redox enzyme family protein [Plectonema radiosum NIES-515]|uniref:Iron-containing redox enzyme family protein n=1 Tax=Plectonema radiosum NIES-515 TaxID=2986073 RepID=A0ABT3ATN1_9CYAN|nr:iron-containing redox enzyme family protein [Plectonema radiosum]MCV3211944.1 iron-containing redox enzyme family protein [Plectonema radiosum NIES-515]
MNRCQNTGLVRKKPFLNPVGSINLRQEIDAFLDRQIEKWQQTIPFANHFEDEQVNQRYYQRHLIETVWRIRLLRVVESKAIAEIAKQSPEAAQIWANYEMEEMLHDELFIQDLEKAGVSREDLLNTEPYLSTKLLVGFFSYLLDHEGSLGVLAYSYLVEYVNVKMEPKKIDAMKKSIGENQIGGQIAHSYTDTNDDHPGEVWNAIRYIIKNEQDIANLKKYLEEQQEILAMYFREIYADIVESAPKELVA